ncbi:MAG TPA: glycerophosphodiester phosphodiesterase [Candidatus Saccharimonadales bacterium]|nr:glycerophosphodiester phosphodiesterase [Candidatus Saccharimonadales bacterium]
MASIIGHRGAAGLAQENTIDSIKAAIDAKIDAVEFDIRRTKDGQLVVLHDRGTGRVAKEHGTIRDLTLAEVRSIILNNGEMVPTLDEVLTAVGSKPAIIETKDEGVTEELVHVLARHPKARPIFASFRHEELRRLQAAFPHVHIYVLEHLSPIDIINSARGLRAYGIGLNKWLMNPFTYYLAKHYSLELYVYSVNSPLLGAFFKLFYPRVHLCTDHPERFIHMKRSKHDRPL